MRQLIIVRKDLNMSNGKLFVQVGHASMAYFMSKIKQKAHKQLSPDFECFRTKDTNFGRNGDSRQLYRHPDLENWCQDAYDKGQNYFYCQKIPDKNALLGYRLVLVDKSQVQYEYTSTVTFDIDTYENWINGIFIKTVCEAKNKNQLMKAVTMAEELGLKENEDFFLIKDNCLTELEPEEVDENGVGRTLTCIGFRPLPDEIAHKISKNYQLYR